MFLWIIEKKTALKSNFSIFYFKYVKQRLRKFHCALKLFPFPASTYYSLHSMYSQFLWDSFFGRCYIDTMFWNDIATGQPDQHENPFHNGAKQFLKSLHYSHLYYYLNRYMYFGCCYIQHHAQTIHPTDFFISMNLLQMSCVITWAWSFLTSEVVEAVRGQKHHISTHTLAL